MAFLSNFVSVIIRMSKVPLTTCLNSSTFDAKKLMLSVPIITNIKTISVPKCFKTTLLVSFIRTGFH